MRGRRSVMFFMGFLYNERKAWLCYKVIKYKKLNSNW